MASVLETTMWRAVNTGTADDGLHWMEEDFSDSEVVAQAQCQHGDGLDPWDSLDAEGGSEADEQPPPTIAQPPQDDTDLWPSHPAGPAGSWLRARIEDSWRLLKEVTGRDLFNPPMNKRSGVEG